MANINQIGVSHQSVEINGTRYVVTTGTGERNYGSELGGSAAFAYDGDEVEELDQPANYAEFCDALSPVGEDDPNWLELAVALARLGMRLTVAGACTPALTDREYQIARIAIVAGQRVTGGEGADRDTGVVDSIDGDMATVRSDSGVTTPVPVADLEPTIERHSGGRVIVG